MIGTPALKIRASTIDDGVRVLQIWQRAVDDSHDFLVESDRHAIAQEVAGFLLQAPLVLAVDAADRPLGFMLLSSGPLGGHMEALFIDPASKGQGVGTLLVRWALGMHPQLTTDVNAQNPQAMAFYRALGFVETGRSPLDGQGRAYPLVHLRHQG
ncbi:acetyltransferase [Comamonas testosteroni]